MIDFKPFKTDFIDQYPDDIWEIGIITEQGTYFVVKVRAYVKDFQRTEEDDWGRYYEATHYFVEPITEFKIFDFDGDEVNLTDCTNLKYLINVIAEELEEYAYDNEI